MHYRIENEAGVFAVSVAIHNGVELSGVAFECWAFAVAGPTTQSDTGRAMVIRDLVAGSAERREDVAVRAAGLCLAAEPTAGRALVWFRDDPNSYQGMVTFGDAGTGIDIPMTDREVRALLYPGTPLSTTADRHVHASVRKEAAWTRPSNRSFSSRTLPISFE